MDKDWPIERSGGVTLRDRVLESLKSAIVHGRIESGSKINESKMADLLEVSRGTLREALRELEQQGYVQNIPYRGTFVVELSPEECFHVCAARGALEGFAAAQARPEARKKLINQLRHLLNDMEEAIDREDWEDLPTLDYSFHYLICEAAENPHLLKLWETQTGPLLAHLASRFPEIIGPRDMVDIHRRLADTIATGNSSEIEDCIRGHYQRTAEWYAAHIHTAGRNSS